MTSLSAVPLQLLATSSEIFFVLENKLRIQRDDFNVPWLQCDSIMEDALGRVLLHMKLDELFKARKALTLDELRQFFKLLDHEGMSFESDSFEKLFMVACMTVKVQLTRIDSSADVLFVVNRKMHLLQELFSNPLVKDDLCRRRDAVNVFYQSLSSAELNRVRATILNSLRSVCIPVSILINEGVQLKSGKVIARKTGPNARNLGLCRIFADETGGCKEDRFSVADAENARKEGTVAVSGDNLFDADRIATVSEKKEGGRSSDEECFELARDMGDDILFGSGATSSAMSSLRSATSYFE